MYCVLCLTAVSAAQPCLATLKFFGFFLCFFCAFLFAFLDIWKPCFNVVAVRRQQKFMLGHVLLPVVQYCKVNLWKAWRKRGKWVWTNRFVSGNESNQSRFERHLKLEKVTLHVKLSFAGQFWSLLEVKTQTAAAQAEAIFSCFASSRSASPVDHLATGWNGQTF